MYSLLLVSSLFLTKLVNVPRPNGTKRVPENSANQPSLATVCKLVFTTTFLILLIFVFTKKW